MPDVPQLAKAELRELDAQFANEINRDKWTKVQFNPDSLKVSFANQIQQPQGGGDQNGPQAQQFVGAGTTKLAVTLVFDITTDFPQGLDPVDDVRKLTQKVAYYITPKGDPPNKPKKYIPPAVRFLWGSLQFDGIMESLDESLEMFSFEGRPLRATVSLAITQQRITEFKINDVNQAPGVTRRGGAAPGTSPLTEAPAGSSLQSLAANSGSTGPAGFGGSLGVGFSAGISGGLSAGISGGVSGGLDWQTIAQANGIENPRLLQPGQLIDLNPPLAKVTFE
jgi:contractile injection system tube protein